MPNVFVTSDTHFNHANILRFTDYSGRRVRDFDSLQEMNEHLIAQWNSVVRSEDIVHHLGDVFFGPRSFFEQQWPRLNGKKKLIVGNHDDVRYLASLDRSKFFYDVALEKRLGTNLYLTHVPIHPSGLITPRKSWVNVHGHIHTNSSPNGPYINVCVEVRDYAPVSLEDLEVEARKLI